MFEAFFKDKLGPLALRLALGLFCAYHGYLKIMAAGGTAWNPALGVAWQLLVAWGEFAGGLAILLGFRCRLAAAGVLFLSSGLLVWNLGWRLFSQPVSNLEMSFLFLLATLALLFLGAGELSLDARSGGGGGAKRR